MNVPGVAAYFGEVCEKYGMLVRVSGDTITMSPPFCITPEEIDEVPLYILTPSILGKKKDILPSI